MFFIMLLIILAVGFVVQYIFGFVQIKHFTKHYTELREKGRVAIGRRPTIIRSGTLVLFQLNNKNEIEESRYMQGVTVFSRIKHLKGLEGKKINKLGEEDLANYNKLLQGAIHNAQHTFRVVQAGGEIEQIPSPMMKVVKKVNSMFTKKGVKKHGLHS
ncbi:transcriptional regulator GutM [Virgibacillus sp. NKC19-16]|uniref:transcriptional regulator GutM n=1 Tax=Virgibacillus salidurans TaxID=2831673 RepID=UPI001F1A9AA3|nr:transcriptional regulator GutM [Virgibacillus sp. NKC19-16]UJL47390.1 transcriptional regulator GutM [Virgibacillus sp. NKC19-16]